MYAAWLEGATEAGIRAIKQAMELRPAAHAAIPDQRTAITAVNAEENRTKLIVIRPLESPEFGSRKWRAEHAIESRADKVAVPPLVSEIVSGAKANEQGIILGNPLLQPRPPLTRVQMRRKFPPSDQIMPGQR